MTTGVPATLAQLVPLDPLRQAVERSQDWFRRTQDAQGYWWGELESNPTMEAEYLLLVHFLGAREDGERIARIVQGIQARQRDDGTWGMYFGAPGDLSTTIECYFALKLWGVPADAPAMKKAREFILRKGGVRRARTFTRIWLALFGQWDWHALPTMPPELMLLSDSAPLSIYRFASWARATIVPLLVLMNDRPVCAVPQSARLDELYPRPEDRLPVPTPRFGETSAWTWAFHRFDRVLRHSHRVSPALLRKRARDQAEKWIVAHQEADGSWGGIQPPWVYSLMALRHLGYPLDHQVMRRGLEGFRGRWTHTRPDGTLRVQACLSPVWDTCLALVGLLDSGVPGDDEMARRAAKWLLSQEIRVAGDWAVQVKGVEPSGWAFEFENDLYPDVDDTAIVLMALHRVRFGTAREEAERLEAIHRGIAWTLAMQCTNGGWAAFDKDNDTRLPAMLPFCDFGEVLDPPSVDVTAHVLEMLGRLGLTREHPAVRRGLAFLRARQEPDGSWFGRWGVNHVYGVGAVLPAFAALGEDLRAHEVGRAVGWLAAHQNADGGWGESCASYVEEPLRGTGESTPSQTAWALLGLVAAGRVEHPATRRGAAYLVDSLGLDGTWEEAAFTGCGFPGYGFGDQPSHLPREGEPGWQGRELSAGFMIRYDLYRNYFPLMALGRYRAALERLRGGR